MTRPSPRIFEREQVYSGKILSVYKYHIQLGDKNIEREIIERRHGVAIVPVDVNHNILLIREYYAGSNSFILSLPGGSIEGSELEYEAMKEESIREEAMRELREETGYKAKEMLKLHYAFSHPAISNRRSFTFLGYDLTWDPLESTDEFIEVCRLPLEDAIQLAYQDFESDMSTIGNLLMARDKLAEFGL